MSLNRFIIPLTVTSIFLFSIYFLSNLKLSQLQYPDNRIKIVASFFPLADFAKKIGQEKVLVDILFLQSPEVSGITPKDIIKLKEADLILLNGVNFEVALNDLLKSDISLLEKAIDTSKGVELLDNDPHIWLDPYRAFLQAQNIKEALIKIDPQNSDYYEQNFQKLGEELNNLDLKIASSLEIFPKKDLITFHSAFIYFNKRYGLNEVAVIEEFTGKEPSASYLAEVIDKIKQYQVKAIFSEPQFSPKIVQAIAKDLGLKIFSLDPVESGDLQKESYISKMEKNLKTLIEAFSL